MLASVILMTVDHRQHHLETVRAMLSVVLYPVRLVVHFPFQAGKWVHDELSSRHALREENQRLRHEHLLIQARLGRFEELEAENERLRRLLDSSRRASERVLIAEVLSVEMDPYSRQILLNKGRNDGAFEGQPLIDSQGVMGQVVHADPFTATALLITDPGHALPVQLNRNGLRAVAVGAGASNTLRLVHLPNNADIAVGDLVVTSGLGGRFPPGFRVGRVRSVETDSGQPFAKVVVAPAAQLERNREVLLVWPAPRLVSDEPGGEPEAPPAGAEAEAQGTQEAAPARSLSEEGRSAPASPAAEGSATPPETSGAEERHDPG